MSSVVPILQDGGGSTAHRAGRTRTFRTAPRKETRRRCAEGAARAAESADGDRPPTLFPPTVPVPRSTSPAPRHNPTREGQPTVGGRSRSAEPLQPAKDDPWSRGGPPGRSRPAKDDLPWEADSAPRVVAPVRDEAGSADLHFGGMQIVPQSRSILAVFEYGTRADDRQENARGAVGSPENRVVRRPRFHPVGKDRAGVRVDVEAWEVAG